MLRVRGSHKEVPVQDIRRSLQEGYKNIDIARMYNVSPACITYWRKKILRPKKAARLLDPPTYDYTQEWIDWALEAKASGFYMYEIAYKSHLELSAVWYRFKHWKGESCANKL